MKKLKEYYIFAQIYVQYLRGIKADTILFDIWYANVENIKFIHRLGKKFITKLKKIVEWIITNHAPGSIDAQVIQEKNKVR